LKIRLALVSSTTPSLTSAELPWLLLFLSGERLCYFDVVANA
jgi:hypothetical protein